MKAEAKRLQAEAKQSGTKAEVRVRPCPRFVIGTPDSLAKHDWGHIGTKQFLLVTEVRLFGQVPFNDYVLSSPLDEARIFFLDTKRAIWTQKYAGRIMCSVGPIRRLTDRNLDIIPYPTIRSIKLRWNRLDRSLSDIPDLLHALDTSGDRVQEVVQNISEIASTTEAADIVVISPTKETSAKLATVIGKRAELRERNIRSMATSDFASFVPTRETVICWTGARRSIHSLLESLVLNRRGSQVIHWVDFADQPVKSPKKMPKVVGELIRANRHREETYRQYGFVPHNTHFFDYCLGLGEKEIIHG